MVGDIVPHTAPRLLFCEASRMLLRRTSLSPKRRAYNTTRQLADDFAVRAQGSSSAAAFSSLKSPQQTLTEKIVQRHSVGLAKGQYVKSGDYVTLSPHHCMTHDNSLPTMLKFFSMGASRIHDPNQIVMTLDHNVQDKSEHNLKKYRRCEEFANSQGVDFYPAGRGIGHQIMVEEGYAWPGTLAVASDSHSNMYGGVGCLGTPVVRTDAASIWATGVTWWQVPPIAKVFFRGTLPAGVTGKDVIVALCGLFNQDEVLNHAIEFTGSEETMQSLPVDARLTIANMTTEWGALSGLFPIDRVLERWLRYKATEAALYQSDGASTTFKRFSHQRLDDLFANHLSADEGAKFAKHLFLDLSTVSPYVSGPNSVKIATPLAEIAQRNIKVNKAYLVSCTNARASDLAAAAMVFRDAAKKNGGEVPRIASGVDFYIAAASKPEQMVAEDAGDWQVMLEAGAKALPAGCGPCIGLGTGLLEPGDIGISSSNRNFKGRMGSTEAKAFLASPEVVAASALHGTIRGPAWYQEPEGWSGVSMGEGDGIEEGDQMITGEKYLRNVVDQLDSIIEDAEIRLTHAEDVGQVDEVEILPGFPSSITGELVLLDSDNINTDGIYPGKYTYQDDVSIKKMGEICMTNYDPTFSSIAREGDILIAGFNFGCGSSREQAATAILAKKIPLVVAASFGNIFLRNAINNGLIGLEIPNLVRRLRETFSDTQVQGLQQAVLEPSHNRESLDSPTLGPQTTAKQEKVLTRRTGWKFTWDVRTSKVHIEEGEGGPRWSESVAKLSLNLQDIIARGGLEKWVKNKIDGSQAT